MEESQWCFGPQDELGQRRKQVRRTVSLLRSLSDKYSRENNETPFSLEKKKLNSTTEI